MLITARSARILYMVFAFLVLFMSWEYQKVNPALASSDIPEEAIRLRILADSDRPQDQWVKQQVRDRIVESMNAWVTDPQDIETARAEVEARLQDFERIVGEELARLGVDQPFTVSYGPVDFPAKLYGNKVYPAGVYESLLVTLGDGEGRNWWCVLFPPLCFVEVASGEAISKSELEAGEKQEVTVASAAPADEEKEVKFFLVELFQDLLEMLKGWF